MSATLYREGRDLDELLAELDGEFPGRVRVLEILHPREGGFLGFFARQRVGVHYRLLDGAAVDHPGMTMVPTAQVPTDTADPADTPAPLAPPIRSADEFAAVLAQVAQHRAARQTQTRTPAPAAPGSENPAPAVPASGSPAPAAPEPAVRSSALTPMESLIAAATARQAAAAARASAVADTAAVSGTAALAQAAAAVDTAPAGRGAPAGTATRWRPTTIDRSALAASGAPLIRNRSTPARTGGSGRPPRPPAEEPGISPAGWPAVRAATLVGSRPPSPTAPAPEPPAPAPAGDTETAGRDPGLSVRRRLVEAGVPVDRIPADAPHTYAAVEALVAGLPAAPRPPSTAGDLLALVGPAGQAVETAEALITAGAIRREDVFAYRCGEAGLGADQVLTSAGEARTLAMTRRQTGARAGVVIVPVDVDSTWADPAADVITALAPAATWAVVDATGKPADTRARLAALTTVDALVAVRCAHSSSPATVWDLGAPIALVDGHRSTRGLWAALLLDRLSGMEE